MKLRDLPKIERPREKLISKGPQNLKDKIGLKKPVFCDLNFLKNKGIVKERKQCGMKTKTKI